MNKEGIVLKAVSGFYYVRADGNTYECKARGSFRKAGVSPFVGDRVAVTVDGEKGVIEKVYERKNLLYRPMVANIDKLFIVSSFSVPAPDTLLIDRLSATAVYHGIKPIIVFNKCDLGDFSHFEEIYLKTEFPVFTVSANTGENIEALKVELQNSVCAFAGNSGVGKSSLLNAIFGDNKLETGEVSEKLGRGRHTTRHCELYDMGENSFVVDTPGFSAMETDNDYSFKEQLELCFPEFSEYIYGCKFTSCTHTCEKGCGVIEAVKRGEISDSRHKSYVAIFEELKDLKPWNSQKRKKL